MLQGLPVVLLARCVLLYLKRHLCVGGLLLFCVHWVWRGYSGGLVLLLALTAVAGNCVLCLNTAVENSLKHLPT